MITDLGLVCIHVLYAHNGWHGHWSLYPRCVASDGHLVDLLTHRVTLPNRECRDAVQAELANLRVASLNDSQRPMFTL